VRFRARGNDPSRFAPRASGFRQHGALGETRRGYRGGMALFPASVLVDIFDIEAFVGLALLALAVVIVMVAAIREHGAGQPARRDEEPLA
jgi:hypothetical protein